MLLSSLSHPPIGSLCSLPSISLSHLRFNTTRKVSSKEKKLPSKPAPIPAFPFRIPRPFDSAPYFKVHLQSYRVLERKCTGCIDHSYWMPLWLVVPGQAPKCPQPENFLRSQEFSGHHSHLLVAHLSPIYTPTHGTKG